MLEKCLAIKKIQIQKIFLPSKHSCINKGKRKSAGDIEELNHEEDLSFEEDYHNIE